MNLPSIKACKSFKHFQQGIAKGTNDGYDDFVEERSIFHRKHSLICRIANFALNRSQSKFSNLSPRILRLTHKPFQHT